MLENKDIILQQASKVCKNTLMETLNIEPVDVGEDFLILRMPVNSRVYQPDGVLHGGATAASGRYGLLGCIERVENHGASIEIDSRKDGTTITITL